MAATCEISNIFSNYFSAMYSSEDPTQVSAPPAANFGADDLVLTLSNTQMPLQGTGGSRQGEGAIDPSEGLFDKQGLDREEAFLNQF